MSKARRALEAERSRTPERAFALTLRKIRRKRGYSQDRLAHESGYHRTYIGMLERGEKSPSLRTIVNIATTLRVKPSYIVASVERVLIRTHKS